MKINKLLREALLNEGYAEQRELVQYAKAMLTKICDTLFTNYLNQGRVVECGITNASVKGNTDFEHITDFVQNRRLILIITPDVIHGDERKVGNYFAQKRGERHEQSVIILRLFKEHIQKINDLYEQYDNEAEVHITKMVIDFHLTTVIHELQHDFDDFRSNSKYHNVPNYSKFKELDARSGELYKKGIKNLSPEEKEEYYKGLAAYVNLPYELNARFAQALQDINIEDTTKNWDTLYKEFIQNMYEWKRIEEPYKKRLIKRLFKAHQEIIHGEE